MEHSIDQFQTMPSVDLSGCDTEVNGPGGLLNEPGWADKSINKVLQELPASYSSTFGLDMIYLIQSLNLAVATAMVLSAAP
jgi:hypothetical protein